MGNCLVDCFFVLEEEIYSFSFKKQKNGLLDSYLLVSIDFRATLSNWPKNGQVASCRPLRAETPRTTQNAQKLARNCLVESRAGPTRHPPCPPVRRSPSARRRSVRRHTLFPWPFIWTSLKMTPPPNAIENSACCRVSPPQHTPAPSRKQGNKSKKGRGEHNWRFLVPFLRFCEARGRGRGSNHGITLS